MRASLLENVRHETAVCGYAFCGQFLMTRILFCGKIYLLYREKMIEQNELDSTCGVSDDELTAEQEAERQREECVKAQYISEFLNKIRV